MICMSALSRGPHFSGAQHFSQKRHLVSRKICREKRAATLAAWPPVRPKSRRVWAHCNRLETFSRWTGGAHEGFRDMEEVWPCETIPGPALRKALPTRAKVKQPSRLRLLRGLHRLDASPAVQKRT
jgi:hypothetical protein